MEKSRKELEGERREVIWREKKPWKKGRQRREELSSCVILFLVFSVFPSFFPVTLFSVSLLPLLLCLLPNLSYFLSCFSKYILSFLLSTFLFFASLSFSSLLTWVFFTCLIPSSLPFSFFSSSILLCLLSSPDKKKTIQVNRAGKFKYKEAKG